jgi:hypothetical protein
MDHGLSAARRTTSLRHAAHRHATQRYTTQGVPQMAAAPPEFKESKNTRIIYELFKEAPTRDPPLITWLEITEATGQPVAALRGNVATAAKRLRTVDGKVIECDRGVGYRVVPDRELSEVGRKHIRRARRIQREGLAKVTIPIDLTKLSPTERLNHYTTQSALALALEVTKPQTINKVDQMVQRKQNQMSAEEMLRAIKETLEKK